MKKYFDRPILLLTLILINSIILFYPRFGSPSFRYTGSNPEAEVLNLGLPIAHFIYDSSQDFPIIFGPLAEIVILVCFMTSILIYKFNVILNILTHTFKSTHA